MPSPGGAGWHRQSLRLRRPHDGLAPAGVPIPVPPTPPQEFVRARTIQRQHRRVPAAEDGLQRRRVFGHDHVCHLGRAFGDGAGLVQHDGSELVGLSPAPCCW
ncbi:MAG: hypothetical protein R2856_26310 [Caldilineaceae bacterium]